MPFKNTNFKHDNIQLHLPNDCIFSIACWNERHEVAVMDGNGFVSVSTWYANGDQQYDDDVLPISGTAIALDNALDKAIAWATKEKNKELSQAWDQAL